MLTLDVIELNQNENIAMMKKINCLEQKLHPIALSCMTANERQQLLEELCALPEPGFQKLWENSDIFAELQRRQVEIEHHRKTITENAQKALEVTLEEVKKAKAGLLKRFLRR